MQDHAPTPAPQILERARARTKADADGSIVGGALFLVNARGVPLEFLTNPDPPAISVFLPAMP